MTAKVAQHKARCLSAGADKPILIGRMLFQSLLTCAYTYRRLTYKDHTQKSQKHCINQVTCICDDLLT